MSPEQLQQLEERRQREAQLNNDGPGQGPSIAISYSPQEIETEKLRTNLQCNIIVNCTCLIVFSIMFSYKKDLLQKSNNFHWVEINLGVYAAQFLVDIATIRKLVVSNYNAFNLAHVIIITLYSSFGIWGLFLFENQGFY